MLDGVKKMNGSKHSCCGNLIEACSWVLCTCNLANKAADFGMYGFNNSWGQKSFNWVNCLATFIVAQEKEPDLIMRPS